MRLLLGDSFHLRVYLGLGQIDALLSMLHSFHLAYAKLL